MMDANIEQEKAKVANEFEHRTSNIDLRTPNRRGRKEQTERIIFLSLVRRWKFGVRCWVFAFLLWTMWAGRPRSLKASDV